MFVGHDHDNDFGAWHDGIELGCGRKTGYHTYDDLHGARVVVLKENYDTDGKLSQENIMLLMRVVPLNIQLPLHIMKEQRKNNVSLETLSSPTYKS